MRFSLRRSTLSAIVLATVFLCGDAAAQFRLGWVRQFSSNVTDASATPDSVYVVETQYVHKYSLEGNLLWTQWFGTPTYEYNAWITAAPDGVYVVWSTFWPSFYFVRKFDQNGNSLWTRQSAVSGVWNIAGASAGVDSVYVVGSNSELGQSERFIHKYDRNGNKAWTGQFGPATQPTA
jgi:hypothetical protein